MKTSKLALAVLIVLIHTFFACKKDKNNNGKKPDCRLKAYIEDRPGNPGTWEFTYNSDGKVSSIKLTYSGGVTIAEFTYTGNTILTIAKNSGQTMYEDSITLDSKGRPANTRRYYNGTRTSWENTAFEYNVDDLSKLTNTNSSSGIQTKTATYSNGNLIALQSPTNTATYEYFPEETQVADYLNVSGYLNYGFGIYPHKNLVKSLSSGGSTTSFTYEKNGDGLIIKGKAITAGVEVKMSYEYECN